MLKSLSKVLEVSTDELLDNESEIYISRLKRHGLNTNVINLSQISTKELIKELNKRDDYKLTVKNNDNN